MIAGMFFSYAWCTMTAAFEVMYAPNALSASHEEWSAGCVASTAFVQVYMRLALTIPHQRMSGSQLSCHALIRSPNRRGSCLMFLV